jgi:hypothetical protein
MVLVWEDRFKRLRKRNKPLDESIISANRPHSANRDLESIELILILSLIDIDYASLV